MGVSNAGVGHADIEYSVTVSGQWHLGAHLKVILKTLNLGGDLSGGGTAAGCGLLGFPSRSWHPGLHITLTHHLCNISIEPGKIVGCMLLMLSISCLLLHAADVVNFMFVAACC